MGGTPFSLILRLSFWDLTLWFYGFWVEVLRFLGFDCGVSAAGFWFSGSGVSPASTQKVILLLCLLTVKPPIIFVSPMA